MKTTLGLLTVVAIALAGAASAQEPIKIGVNLELSGRLVALGTPELEGIRAALEQQPEILGRPVELSVCDNGSTPEGSIACANRFVDEGVVAVIGTGGSSQAIPAAEVLQDAGIIQITPSSTNNATTQIGDYIFRMAYNDAFQGEVAAGYAADELGASRVAIFRQQDDDYSFGLAGFFQDSFEALGGETMVVDIVANQVDFAAQINEVRAFNPDAIYAPIFCSEAAPLVVQLRQQGFTDIPLLGADASDDPQCVDGAGEAINGWTFTAFAIPEQLTGEAAERAEAFQEFFGESQPEGTFNGFTLAGADSYNVLAEAITQAGEADPAAVRDALANITDFPGVTGNITYEGTDGTPADRVMGFFTYEDATYPGTPLFDVSTGQGDDAAGEPVGGGSGGN
jgi:branched-chain amino acid transport system substrate-binding protein